MNLPPIHMIERDGCKVTVQHGTYGRSTRWAYVLDLPGEYPFVSKAFYHTPEAALAAGDRDLSATLALFSEQYQRREK